MPGDASGTSIPAVPIAHVATSTGLSAADIIQIFIAVATGGAAVAAWMAALTSRKSAKDTRDSARETAIGQLIGVHTQRVAALAQLHSKLLWVSEGNRGRNSTARPPRRRPTRSWWVRPSTPGTGSSARWRCGWSGPRNGR